MKTEIGKIGLLIDMNFYFYDTSLLPCPWFCFDQPVNFNLKPTVCDSMIACD